MIILTGASGGIGKELTLHFLDKGNFIYATYNKNKPDFSSSEKLHLEKVNLKDFQEVNTWVQSIKKSLNNIVLINNAGMSYNSMAHKSDIQKWKEVIDINVTGTFNLILNLLPIMREQQFGRIINISSVLANKGYPGTSSYATSKAALTGLAKSLAVENAKYNITVNNLCLGYMETGMTGQIPDNYLHAIIDSIPVKKLGPVDEVSKAIEYLIEAHYITGTNIDINGGLY